MKFLFSTYRDTTEDRRKASPNSKEIRADSIIQAVEKAAVRLIPGRVIEIRLIEPEIGRPSVPRVEREGVW